MNRIQLIREIFAKSNLTNYLEIGTRKGRSFLPVMAENKVAIDPALVIPFYLKFYWEFKNPNNKNNNYFDETSDEFFEKRQEFLTQLGHIDVVLVDGLHTYEAALKDTLNSLEHLSDNGVIILHDCLPPNKFAALPTKQFPTKEEKKKHGWTGAWCGDVWKAIVYLRERYPDELDTYVIDTDYGLGIVRKKTSITDLSIDKEIFDRINKIDFEEMMPKVDHMLGRKEVGQTQKLIQEIQAKS